jgi:ribosome maturation protein SDO1
VSKGHTAPAADLAKSFGAKTPLDEIIQEILRKGEVQVGERERRELLERVEKEVLEIVSARLVDPVSKRVYTTGMISKALDQISAASGQHGGGKGKGHEAAAPKSPTTGDATSPTETAPSAEDEPEASSDEEKAPRKPMWTGVVTTKSAKNQALDAMKALIAWQPIPVMRARMRLRITCPTSLLKQAVKSSASTTSGAAATPHAKHGHKKRGSVDMDRDEHHKASTATGTVKDRILGYLELVEMQDVVGTDQWQVVGFAEPGAFKGLSEFVGGETKGKGRVEVLDMAVTHED